MQQSCGLVLSNHHAEMHGGGMFVLYQGLSSCDRPPVARFELM